MTRLMLVLASASYLLSQDSEWEFLGLGTESVHAIAINYENDSIVYVGTYSDFSSGTYGSIFKSINAGATWDTLFYGLSVIDITIHPQNPDILFASLGVANFTQSGVFKFDGDGGNYEWLNEGIPVDWETSVYTLEIDPVHPDTMYAGTVGFHGGLLYKTTNGGELWELIGHPDSVGGIYDDNIHGIAIDPFDTEILYVCAGRTGTLHKSVDGGETWMEVFNTYEENIPASFLDVEIDPVNPNTIYAALGLSHIGYGGMLKSVDAGSTWVLINNGLPEGGVKSITINPVDTETLYIAGGGVFETNNAGETWTPGGLNNPSIITIEYNRTGSAIYGGARYVPSLSLPGGVRKRTFPLNIDPGHAPFSFSLKPNFPNPFNNRTLIPFTLKAAGVVEIEIIDIKGRFIKNLSKTFYRDGDYTIIWNGTDFNNSTVPSGLYFYHFRHNAISQQGKMILLK